MKKLYVIVRSDLPPGAQVAQSCHALRLFVEQHHEIDADWYATSNNLVCLQVASEHALLDLHARANEDGVAASLFREPDCGDAATALALAPDGWKLVSSLPLTLRRAA